MFFAYHVLLHFILLLNTLSLLPLWAKHLVSLPIQTRELTKCYGVTSSQEKEDEDQELFEGEQALTSNFATLLHTSIKTHIRREAA